MRLIDADALVEVLKDPPLYASLGGMTMEGVFMLIDNEAPTIDAVPVVRCKDCRNWSEMQNSAGACLRQSVIDGSWWTGTDSTDYCSFAERRDDD